MVNGSIPADGGNLILSEKAYRDLISNEPRAERWTRPYVGAEDFIHNDYRWCLWLLHCPPNEMRQMPEVLKRVSAVRKMREASDKTATRQKAAIPTQFTENRQPTSGNYLAVPRTSSEARRYIPTGFLTSDVIAANDLQLVPGIGTYHFGIITSAMHLSWARVTSGRLKSDIRYSVKFTYNTFPWPQNATDKQKAAVEAKAQAVLDARAAFPGSSLADLYDPLTMPPKLAKAHAELDRAVDACYRDKPFHSDRERIEFLFELYEKLTAPLTAGLDKKAKRKRKGGDNGTTE